MNLPPGILNRLQTMPAYSHAQVIGWIRSRNRWRALALALMTVLGVMLAQKCFSADTVAGHGNPQASLLWRYNQPISLDSSQVCTSQVLALGGNTVHELSGGTFATECTTRPRTAFHHNPRPMMSRIGAGFSLT